MATAATMPIPHPVGNLENGVRCAELPTIYGGMPGTVKCRATVGFARVAGAAGVIEFKRYFDSNGA